MITLPELVIFRLVSEVVVLLIVRDIPSAIEVVPKFTVVSPASFNPTTPILTFHDLLIFKLSSMVAFVKFKFPDPLISELV